MWKFRVLAFLLFIVDVQSLNEEEKAAEEFLSNYDILITVLKNEQTKALWNYETNLTEINKNLTLEVGAKYSLFDKEAFQVLLH